MNMKKLLFLLASVLMMAATTMVYSACSTDNDDDDPVAPNIVSIEYAATLGDAWMQFYDITITYTTDEGTKTETYLGPEPFHFVKQNIPASLAPKTYMMTVEIKPKYPMPEFDPIGNYNFSYDCAALGVLGNFEMKNPMMLFLDNQRMPLAIPGTNVENFVKSRSGVIYSYSKTI